MSCIPVRTNYVRPHVKASYIRPLLCQSEKENMHKDFVDNLPTSKSPEFPDKELSSLKNPDFFKSIDDTKEKHIHNLSSAHSKLYAQIDKIQIWTASFESECKKKDKKADELKQTVESQRKVLVDLQMQNENLSTKLDQEIQQRVSVLKNFYFTKELFSTLRKNVIDLQGQFDACSKIKIALDVCCEENAKTVEDLIEKMNTLSVRYSENIVTLNNSLKNEQNNNLMLKKLFEQQNLSAEKEHKSLCKLIENYQEEIKNYAKDLDDEKNKVLSLQQEKNDLLQRIGELEQSEETNMQKLEDVKKELQLTMESKLETEKKCSLESEKVNNLSKKIEELEELVNKQKNDFDEKCLALKTAINSLENSLSETQQKLVECESEKEMLSGTLQEQEKEKGLLENEISAIQKENKELQNKLIIDAKISDESISLLMKEKNDLERSITLLKDDLQTALLDKEKLSKMCSEGDKKLSEMHKEYEIAAGKIKELSFVEERYFETLKKVEEMEADMQLQSNLLASKEQEIKEMQQLKLKYDECLIKIKEHENSLLSFSDELKVKEMKINELTISEEKLSKAIIKIEELESDLSSKNDLLISKEMKINELTISEEELNKALIKIEEMEFDLSSKNDLLMSKELCIEEMNSIKQNYDSAVEKIKEMEETIKHKTELLQEEEKKAMDLAGILKENSKKLEKLEYENLEMKDCLEKEQGSVKICLECEMLKDKVTELDTFKTALMEKEKELNKQKLQTSQITKMLSETEENFDEMRIKKEKEIIKCKDTIQSLQHELKILKVEVNEAEKVRCENDKLHLTIEEIKLQNAGDIQRLKAEIESLKAKENISHSESAVSQKLSATPSEKIKPEPKKGQVIEPDSSDEVTIIEEENLQMSTMYKKFSKAINRKVINHQIQQSTPLPHLEKRKRAWETESSGSECLEIIFDKNAKKVAGFTPKARSPYAPVKTPVNLISSGKTSTSEDKRRDILKITDTETPKNDQSDSNTVIHFATKSAPQNKKAEQINSSDNMDFLRVKNNIKETPKKNQSNSGTVTHFATKSTPQNRKTEQINSSENMDFSRSKNSVKEVNFATSPWREQAVEIKRTPSTPSDRKFFKTPLKERENSFPKPRLQKLWF